MPVERHDGSLQRQECEGPAIGGHDRGEVHKVCLRQEIGLQRRYGVNIHPLIRAGWLRVPPVTSGRDACLRRAGSQL